MTQNRSPRLLLRDSWPVLLGLWLISLVSMGCWDSPKMPPKKKHDFVDYDGIFGWITPIGKFCPENANCVVSFKIKNNGKTTDSISERLIYDFLSSYEIKDNRGDVLYLDNSATAGLMEWKQKVLKSKDSVQYHFALAQLHTLLPYGVYTLTMKDIPSNTVVVHLIKPTKNIWTEDKGVKSDTIAMTVKKPRPYVPFGTVQAGTKLSYWFHITNDYDSPVLINRVSTGDGGCYPYLWKEGKASKKFKEVIMPGAMVDLEIVQLTKGHSGAKNKSIVIYYSDTARTTKWSKGFLFYGYVEPLASDSVNTEIEGEEIELE